MFNLFKVDNDYRKATQCRSCFEDDAKLKPGFIDVAQPRWIGPEYAKANPRVLFVLVNPGSGKSDDPTYNNEARKLMRGYRDGYVTLSEVLIHQGKYLKKWGRGRFLEFYTTKLGLDTNKIAFLNIALCSTENNSYPSKMLSTCFIIHTAQIICDLDPHLVVLSGKSIEKFRDKIKCDGRPDMKVYPMLHYANRKPKGVEDVELKRIRTIIDKLKK